MNWDVKFYSSKYLTYKNLIIYCFEIPRKRPQYIIKLKIRTVNYNCSQKIHRKLIIYILTYDTVSHIMKDAVSFYYIIEKFI